MARSVDAAIVTAAGLLTQEVCYAVEVGYATPKRITNRERAVTIGSDSYTPGDLSISSLVCSGEPSNTATVTVGNDPGSSSSWGRLDLSEDTTGKTVKIYEVWDTASGQKNHLVFDGVVTDFRGASTQCVIVCRRDVGASTRPGNYICWTDEFPHTPEAGTVIEIGSQSAPIPNNPQPYRVIDWRTGEVVWMNP
jgi:hypothetical protein